MLNFYLIEKADEQKMTEILTAVKQFLKERLSGAIEDPVLKLASEGLNPFFLKTQAGIIWVRLFDQPLAITDLPGIQADIDRVSTMFRQKIRYYFFAPRYDSEITCLRQSGAEILPFEYFFLRSRFGQGIAIREYPMLPASEVIKDIPSEESLAGPQNCPAGRFRNVRLDREELSELIDLSLELKGLVSGRLI